MCTFGVLGLSCEAPAAPKPPGFHTRRALLGPEDFVSAQLEATRKHQALVQAIPTVLDVQSAWSLLLHCATARANSGPDVVLSFARAHDAGVWQCLRAVLRIQDTSEEVARLSASLPPAVGGLGLRSAVRTSAAAHWASWASWPKSNWPRSKFAEVEQMVFALFLFFFVFFSFCLCLSVTFLFLLRLLSHLTLHFLLWGRPGFTRQLFQTCTFQDPTASNTTKIPRKDPQERERRMNIVAGEGKKKREILGPTFRSPHPSEPPPPPFGAPLSQGLFGPPPFGAHSVWSQNSTSRNWQKSQVPSWPALTAGLRLLRESPSSTSRGWLATRSGQSRAEAVPNNVGFTTVFTVKKGHVEVPQWRAAGVAFSALPFSPLTRFQPALFRVLLQRRLALPFPLTLRSCRRGFAVESAAAWSREAGARVGTNLFVRDMDSGVPKGRDNRRLEVVALHWCLQCKATENPPGERLTEMVWLSGARRRKEQTYPEFVQPRAVPG